MIQKIDAKQRHFTDFGWLKTYWLFSFSDYYDPFNIQFGALRVFNDDVVQPMTGFPTHPHKEMEIVTIPLSGEITHADSMGNEALIRAGDVQRMSAGTGLTHSEYNFGDESAHFCQIWLYPDTAGLRPSYDQRKYEPEQWNNMLLPVASGRGIGGTVSMHTDSTIYRCEMDSGRIFQYVTDDGRRTFIYVVGGSVSIDDIVASEGDQLRIDEMPEIEIKPLSDSQIILIDVPSCKGYGYDKTTLRGSKPVK